jgi:hypothetical protein
MRTIPIPAALIEPLTVGAFDDMWAGADKVLEVAEEGSTRTVANVVEPIDRMVRQRALIGALDSATHGVELRLDVAHLPALISAHGMAQATSQDAQDSRWKSLGDELERFGATLASEHYGQAAREAGDDAQ